MQIFRTKVLSGINKKFDSINLSEPRTSAIRLGDFFLFFFVFDNPATYSSGKNGGCGGAWNEDWRHDEREWVRGSIREIQCR